MDALFRLCLLGVPQATANGQPIREFESRKALALLAYLAVRDEPLARTHLADLFWSTLPEAKGRANLSRVLHNLNQLFPDTFHASRDWIQIDLKAFALDICDFETYAMSGTADALAAAAALYRDEFMAGLYLDDCPEFEVWLVAERERWHQRIVSVLECLSGFYARRGQSETALPFTARLLYIEPWHEETHREMMRLLAQTGQRSAALQQYESARRVLAEELNVEPSAETNALYEQIRAEEITSPISPPHNLPTQLTTFFGRETELTRIAARLNNPACRLLTLVGAGGIGKSRLALEAAKNLLGSFRDGVFFVPLASIGAGQTDFIVPAIANALSFTFAGGEEAKTQLLNFLRAKQMLLLLDNFEQLLNQAEGLDGTALVIEILQHAPNVKIFVTSREPLNAQAEWITRVTGLSYPTSVSHNADELGRYSAMQLFVERANRVNAAFELDEETSASVVHICQTVEGMPLAIELAATTLKSMAVEKISEQIASNVDLTTPMHDTEARHSNLRAVLDWSYGLLSDVEQTLFRRTSVFAGGWTLAAAVFVCGGDELPSESVAALLSELETKSLVAQEEREGETRYRMLEPVRQYARERWRGVGEEKTVRNQHLGFFLNLVEQAEPELEKASQGIWVNRLESEIDNLRAAIEWALASEQANAALQLVAGSRRFWYRIGAQRLQIVERLMDFLARPDAQTPTPTRLGALNTYLYLRSSMSGLADDQPLLDETFTLASTMGDKGNTALALQWSAMVAIERGDYLIARSSLEQSIELWRELGNEKDIAVSFYFLGDAAMFQTEHARALVLYEQAVQLLRNGEYRPVLTAALRRLGQLALNHGDLIKADRLFKESLALNISIRDQSGIGSCLAALGALSIAHKDFTRAAKLFGSVDAFLELIRTPLLLFDQRQYEQNVDQLRAQLKESIFANAWKEGRVMAPQQAIAYALEDADTSNVPI